MENHAHLTRQHVDLVFALWALKPPRHIRELDASDVLAYRDHVHDLAQAFNAYVEQVGELLASNCNHIRRKDFASVITDAVDDNILPLLDLAADRLEADEREEIDRAALPPRERSRSLEVT